MNPLTAFANNVLSTYYSGTHLDTNEAYTYYEEKSPGLCERFLQELVKRYSVFNGYKNPDKKISK